MRRRTSPLTIALLFTATFSALGAEPARVETGADGRSWVLANGLVERRVRVDDVLGLHTDGLRRLASGTEFLRGPRERPEVEFAFRTDGDEVRGASEGFEFRDAAVEDLPPGGRVLEVRLRHREKPIDVTASYAVYEGHPVFRKWIAVRNRGARPVTLTNLVVEAAALAPGLPNETQVSGFYGVAPREIFMTGRVDDGLIVLRSARTGEGLGVLNEAPGYLKRTDVLGFDWTSGVRCGYDTDLFPFERTITPGGAFKSAACSIAVFAEGEGLADPGFVLPSYTSGVLLRKGNAYQPPWIYNTWEPFYREIDATSTLGLVEAAGRLGFDVFTIDDGWQARHGANDVRRERFPDGLGPIQKAVEAAGMRLGLWYPLAAIDVEAPDYREHSEWAARERDGRVKETGTAAGSKVVMCLATPYRARAAARLVELIGSYHLAYVKIDLTTIFNTYGESPGCHASGHEHRTWAESLTRIYEGMADISSRVHRAHPDVLLDLTFELWGQKHLIDAGLLAAGDLDWLSNVHDGRPDSAGPLQARTLLYHRALAAPTEAMLIGNLRANTTPVEARFATAIASGPMLLGDLRRLSPDEHRWYAEKIRWFKAVRREIPVQEGFFPQGAWRQPGTLSWDGYARLSRAGEGILVLFRNESREAQAEVRWPAPTEGPFTVRSILDDTRIGPLRGEALRRGVRVPLPAPGRAQILVVRRSEGG
jgi:alpha-galactosidase